MTIEEARKFLDGELLAIVLECKVSSETQKKRLEERFAAFNVAIGAIDKQIPKKPTEYDSVPHARCPHCAKGVRVYCDSAKVPFCQWCGQALDWSDNDD